MDPIFLILYAVIITLLITVFLPQFRDIGPGGKRFLRISAIVGVVALIAVVALILAR